MSFYRKLIVAVAAMGLATAVFADETTGTTGSTDTTTQTTTSAPSDSATATPAADTSAANTTTGDTTTTTTTASADKVDLNKATAKELMKVKGINSARAKAIVMYRKKHGDFKTVDDLKEVKAFKKISDKKWQIISDQLTAG
jgi:competence protein ComEA